MTPVISLQRHWELFPHFVLRRAGFPYDWLDSLAMSRALPELSARTAAERELKTAIAEWNQYLFPTLLSGLKVHPNPATKRALDRAARAIRRGTAPRGEDMLGLSDLAADSNLKAWSVVFESLVENLAQRQERWDAAFANEFAELRWRLRQFAQDSRCCEALFLLNPDLDSMELCTHDAENRSSRTRQKEQILFKYLQRLCAKNETNSFFGPVHYGSITPEADAEPLSWEPDFDESDVERSAFFSHWLIGDIERRISADPRLHDCLPVVSVPSKRKGTLLEWPDRGLSIRELAAAWNTPLEEMRAKVAHSIATGAWELRLPVPPAEVHPIQTLIASLEALEVMTCTEHQAVAEWSQLLHDFANDGRRFAATQEVATKKGIQEAIESRYQDVTGGAIRRHQGRMFRTRNVIYEDAWAKAELGLSTAAATQLMTALAPVLEIGADFSRLIRARMVTEARGVITTWFGSQVRDVAYDHFISAWHAQNERPRSLPKAHVEQMQSLTARIEAFEHLWGESLDQLAETPAELWPLPRFRALVEDLPKTGPYILSPDILPMAKVSGAEAQWVFGEIHHGITMDGWMLSFHPELDRVHALINEQLALALAGSVHVPTNLIIARHMKTAPPEYMGLSVEWSGLAQNRKTKPPFAVKDLVVRMGDTEPWLALYPRDSGKSLQFYPPAFGFAERAYLPFEIFSMPVMRLPRRPGAGFLPRCTHAGLVIARAEWRLAADALAPLVTAKDLGAAIVEGHAFRTAQGMPQHMFLRAQSEPKPLYLDWYNPFSVELLISQCRKGRPLALSEMLPAPQDLCLHGAHGSYTSELRFMITGSN